MFLPKPCLGNLNFSCWITRVSIFQWPEGVSSVNGCFNPNSVCLGNLHFSCWITRVSIFQWPEGVSPINGALTQALFVWAVCFILLNHEDKWF